MGFPAAPSFETPDVTRLLTRWSEGDDAARDALVPIVYERLRDMARDRRRDYPAEVTLNTTALVHEAWLKLADASHLTLPDRSHFLALASRIMRNLLVDHARARIAAKRGAGKEPLPLDEVLLPSEESCERLTELDDALTRLQALSPRQARILERRYFGGLTLEDTAIAEGVSLATVKRELRAAQAWLADQLSDDARP